MLDDGCVYEERPAPHIPLVRRVYPNLIAQDIMSVQPMSSPNAEIFYVDYRYKKDDE